MLGVSSGLCSAPFGGPLTSNPYSTLRSISYKEATVEKQCAAKKFLTQRWLDNVVQHVGEVMETSEQGDMFAESQVVSTFALSLLLYVARTNTRCARVAVAYNFRSFLFWKWRIRAQSSITQAILHTMSNRTLHMEARMAVPANTTQRTLQISMTAALSCNGAMVQRRKIRTMLYSIGHRQHGKREQTIQLAERLACLPSLASLSNDTWPSRT